MRIALDPRCLLGFQGCSMRLDAPVVAAKVGNKPTVGITVLSAASVQANDASSATDPVRLT